MTNIMQHAIRYALAITVLLLLMAVPNLRLVVLIFCIFWAALGVRQSIQSLSIVVLAKFLNPSVFPPESGLALISWTVIAASGLRIIVDWIRSKPKVSRPLIWLLIFFIIVLLQSILFSYSGLISIFKLLSFTFTAVALLAAAAIANQDDYFRGSWFLGIWLAVILLSVPTMFIPDVGYYLDGMGFQGLLSHPQAYAIFLAPAAAWLTGRLFFSNNRGSLVLYVLFVVAWISIFLTRGRTALVAVVGGLLLVGLVALVARRDWAAAIKAFLFRPAQIFVSVSLVLVLVVLSRDIFQAARSFVYKDIDDVVISESFESSRGFLISESMSNFYDHFWFGIGFGVSKSRYMPFEPVIDELTGLPLSASTEKANLAVAVLEETGVVGAFFFCVFMFSLVRQVLRAAEITYPWVFFTCLLTNVGETTFFSVGGLGLYFLLLIAWCLSQISESPRTGTDVGRGYQISRKWYTR
jgi:hypothetical protein